MKFLPKINFKKSLVLFWLIFLVSLQLLVSPVLAQPTPTPTTAPATTGGWQEDPVVTEVGRNSERARQLLFWVVSHPSIFTAPVLGQMWAFSRNVVYVLVILVIVALGLGLILSRRSGGLGPIFSGVSPPFFGLNLPSVFFKVAAAVFYITFSYVLLLGLIQVGEILMRFFIETLGGKDLFNIFFAGQNVEGNYNFIGYRFVDPTLRNLEMINTSLFIVKLTSLTYNVMAAILILRSIILWFFIVISPFLAVLMPYYFIRNTGWVWIGTFFQWLFYGPLVALFLAALTKIWVAGIPFPFDFSRVNCPSPSCPNVNGQIYPTAINILYGGPAQTLTPTNSANYVDTYAEYVIALIMLWAVMFLPWLLLRIFRDYCCEIMEASRVVLLEILNKLRGVLPPPPPPSGPVPTEAAKISLPFRKPVETPVRISLEKMESISQASSFELSQALNLSVASLQDVAEFEMDKRKETKARQSLEKMVRPSTISRLEERERFSQVRSELFSRAAAGDRIAQKIISASEAAPEKVMAVPMVVPMAGPISISGLAQKARVSEKSVGSLINTLPKILASKEQRLTDLSQKTSLSSEKVKEVLNTISTVVATLPGENLVEKVAEKTGVSPVKVTEIINTLPQITQKEEIKTLAATSGLQEEQVVQIINDLPKMAQAVKPRIAPRPVKAPTVTIEDYEEVKGMWVSHYKEAEVPVSERIKTREDWISEDIKNLTNTINLLGSPAPSLKKKGLEQVSSILPFILLGGFSDLETMTYLKAKLEAVKAVEEESKVVTEAKKAAVEEAEKEKVEIKVKPGTEKEKEMVLEEEKEITS